MTAPAAGTSLSIPTIADRYDEATIAAFRSAGFWRDDTLWSRLSGWATSKPDATAFADSAGSCTFAELAADAERIAAGLTAAGVVPGDRVVVQLPNWREFAVVYAALARIGAILVPIMPIYRHDEVGYIVGHAGAAVYVGTSTFRGFDYQAMVDELVDAGTALRLRIVVRGEARAERGEVALDALDGERAALPAPPSADDGHCIIYTSGTESRPKGCFHTFNTMAFTVRALQEDVLRVGPDDVIFMPSPITHATGLGSVASAMYVGCAAYLMDVWEPAEALRIISSHRCTMTVTATPFIRMALDAYDPAVHDLSSFRCWGSGGAPIPESLVVEWMAKVPGTALVPLYGRSEVFVTTTTRLDDPTERIVGSDGAAVPGVEVKLVDETGASVGPGEEGEVCQRGAGVMLGYWQDPERTAASLDSEGYLRSGDLARMDGDGYLRITGRIKDIIIRGGANISAREVEEHLLAHPAIKEAAAVAMPDERLGERVCAFVTLTEGATSPTLAEVADFLRNERKVAPQKLPERLEVVDVLPYTATGKVQKFVLRDLAAQG